MSEIPEDVKLAAEAVVANLPLFEGMTNNAWEKTVEAVARAIMAERERAIAACERQKAIFATDEYATPQPLGGMMERFACDACISAISHPQQGDVK